MYFITNERTYRGADEGGGGLSSAASNVSAMYSQPGAMTEGSFVVCFVAKDVLALTGVVVEGPGPTSLAEKGSPSKCFFLEEMVVDEGSSVNGPDSCILLADKGSFSRSVFLKARLVADGGSFASGGFFLKVKLVRSFGIVCSGFGFGATQGPDPAAIRCFVVRLLPD